MGLIYKRTSPSGKIYIGQTIHDELNRWKSHCRSAKSTASSDYNSPLNRAIRKYGGENFSVEILEDNIPTELLNEREQYYILLYNSNNLKIGYNLTIGGNNKIVESKKDEILKLWQQGYLIKEISQMVNINRNTISEYLKENGITTQEIKERRYKNVLQQEKYKEKQKVFLSLWEQGCSITQIAQITKKDRDSISRNLKYLGVK